MVTAVRPPEQEQDLEIIRSDNWELPVCNLGTGKYEWRPYKAVLPYWLFEGPSMRVRTHGINLNKDLLIGIHGPRGATKTVTQAFLTAKKMRMGQPAWTNYPISFFVVEPTCWDICDMHYCFKCRSGHKTYYESIPLNMDKLYTFNSEITKGVVGMTELQYYAEARTSGRAQNRFLSYQIMQIRKSALSFYYDVQDDHWVDKRFGWSDDCKIFCADLAKMNYDEAAVGHELQEGELSHWRIKDMSGVLTGRRFEDTGIEYGPFQFFSYLFWSIYPTLWKIDVYEAIYSLKQESRKADKDALLGKAIELAVNSFVEENKTKVEAGELWARATTLGGITVPPTSGGRVLHSYGIEKKLNSKGKNVYDLSVLLENGASGEKPK